MLIDTHCHLAFKAFADSWPQVVKRAQDKGIQMIAVGAAKATSEKSIAIAESSGGVFASIGTHPTHVEDDFSAKGGPDQPLDGASGWDYAWFEKAADNPKVVAIGETGIDHFHLPPHPARGGQAHLSPGGRGEEATREVVLQKQEDLLRQHLTIAREKELPVILHSRDRPTPRLRTAGGKTDTSYEHLYRVLTDFGYFNGVLHCYGGDWTTARKFLDLGLMLSFTGIVTYKNVSESLEEVVRNVPLDRFMVETDSPYLAPEPHRGQENEPAFVEYIARSIAEMRGISYDEVAQATTDNAKRFFGI